MLLNLINLDKLRRGIIYAFLLFAVLILQNVVFSRITFLGVRAMFVPAAVVAVGVFQGSAWGGVFGLFAGLFCGMGFHGNLLLFTALFPVLGFFSGLLTEYFMNKHFLAYFFLSVMALAVTAFCQMFRLLVFLGADPADLCRVGGLQVLWSLPFTVPLFFLCRYLASKNLG
ncbi:MAG: hypothetical protein ACOX7I_04955 [Oscillospiraceae bacterium]|jgi:uncharacterized integral membrane protein